MPEYLEDPEEKDYRNPTAQFQNAMLVIFVIAYSIFGWVWGSPGYYNSFFAWGGYIFLGVLLLFKFTPMLIGLRSPKFSSNKIGTTIATPDPITTVEPQGGYPEMALYPAGSVMAMEFFDIKMTTKALVWAPSSLVYALGEQDKGVNVVVNCHLQKLAEQSELAPHLLEATNRITRIGYKQNLPTYVGLFPLWINVLPAERMNEYRKRFADLGLASEIFDGNAEKGIIGVRQILDQYAAETSKFRYGAEFTKPEVMLQTIIRSQNSLVDQLKKDNRFFKTEISALHQMHKYAKDSTREPSWRDRLPMPSGEREQEREDSETGRRY